MEIAISFVCGLATFPLMIWRLTKLHNRQIAKRPRKQESDHQAYLRMMECYSLTYSALAQIRRVREEPKSREIAAKALIDVDAVNGEVAGQS